MFPVSDVIPPRTTPYVTFGLILANSLAFLYELQLDRHELSAFVRAWGLVPLDARWANLLTGLFLHDGWLHVGGNMLWLWIFGHNVEDSVGHGAFLLFYLAAGASAALAHAALDASSAAPLIGAGGAVAAVMGAYFVVFPRSQVLTAILLLVDFDVIEVPAVFYLGVWVLIQLAGGLWSIGTHSADGSTVLAAYGVAFLAGAAMGASIRRWKRFWK